MAIAQPHALTAAICAGGTASHAASSLSHRMGSRWSLRSAAWGASDHPPRVQRPAESPLAEICSSVLHPASLPRGGGGSPHHLERRQLNTAALTLFVALHLSVPRKLPLLILDDPVQSMDDVHIVPFAALMRTLSKEHRRQVVIAVHDRQLFEYLRLELSRAFSEDSLLTLELSRQPRRDTICASEWFPSRWRLLFSQPPERGAMRRGLLLAAGAATLIKVALLGR
jgi:hypothetical protein